MLTPILPYSPSNPIAGTMYADPVSNRVHVFDGRQWIHVAGYKELPETWEEWFEYYINAVDGVVSNSAKLGYVNEEMQGRFPGNYSVNVAGGEWDLVFETPADETWFHLKYDK